MSHLPEDRQVRARLMAVATRLFAEKGYAATSVSEIVSAVGVTKPILYYYFKNKEDLYLQILRDTHAEVDLILDEAERWTGPAVPGILHLADRLIDHYQRRIDVARMIQSAFYGPAQGAPAFDLTKYHERYLRVVTDLVKRGIESGELKPGDPHDITLALSGVVALMMELETSMPAHSPGREGMQRLFRLVLNGVAAKPNDEVGSRKDEG
jgi:TetR/AcrR family transcriptional regulator